MHDVSIEGWVAPPESGLRVDGTDRRPTPRSAIDRTSNREAAVNIQQRAEAAQRNGAGGRVDAIAKERTLTTWMCDHGHHGTSKRATTNEFTYGGNCNGTVRPFTDERGAPVRPCSCTCHS